MHSKEEIHERLVNARNYLDRCGWNQGSLVDSETGAVCLRGALIFGNHSYYLTNRFFLDEVEKFLGFSAGDFGSDHRFRAPYWNDRIATSKEEVLARLDDGIRKSAPRPDLTLETPSDVVVEVDDGLTVFSS